MAKKQSDQATKPISTLAELRQAIIKIGGNNTKRGGKYSESEVTKIFTGLQRKKRRFGIKELYIARSDCNGQGNSKAYEIISSKEIWLDGSKSVEKQLEGLIECYVTLYVKHSYSKGSEVLKMWTEEHSGAIDDLKKIGKELGFSNVSFGLAPDQARCVAEGVSYAVLKNLGLDVRTYCLSDEYKKIAGNSKEVDWLLKECRAVYMDFMKQLGVPTK